MPRVQVNLPDPPRIGFFVLLLVICLLILLNSMFTTVMFHILSAANWRWLKDPRLAQPVLFLMPLILLSLELWFGSVVRRWFRPMTDQP
jgi:hypothetical protein